MTHNEEVKKEKKRIVETEEGDCYRITNTGEDEVLLVINRKFSTGYLKTLQRLILAKRRFHFSSLRPKKSITPPDPAEVCGVAGEYGGIQFNGVK